LALSAAGPGLTEKKMRLTLHTYMLRHGCGYKLANAGHDTRAIPALPEASLDREHGALHGAGA